MEVCGGVFLKRNSESNVRDIQARNHGRDYNQMGAAGQATVPLRGIDGREEMPGPG